MENDLKRVMFIELGNRAKQLERECTERIKIVILRQELHFKCTRENTHGGMHKDAEFNYQWVTYGK